ncbi:hypothetical protein Q1695_014065 [Nippostrongylus brasiliensis]|nr:hypothetical protein Q1695_014065 [Nippostrongylus brasiliensis]
MLSVISIHRNDGCTVGGGSSPRFLDDHSVAGRHIIHSHSPVAFGLFNPFGRHFQRFLPNTGTWAFEAKKEDT